MTLYLRKSNCMKVVTFSLECTAICTMYIFSVAFTWIFCTPSRRHAIIQKKFTHLFFCKQNKIRCSFRNFGEYFSENKTASTHTSYFFCHFMYCVCAKINFSQCHCSFNCNGFYRKQILTQYTIDIVNGRKERREKEFCCQSF